MCKLSEDIIKGDFEKHKEDWYYSMSNSIKGWTLKLLTVLDEKLAPLTKI